MSLEQTGGHTGEPLLQLSDVTKNFGGLAAVQDLNLQIWPREIISIIGPNGAGKTTVFNLITGIYRPTSGEIRFAGQPLKQSLAPTEAVIAAILGTIIGAVIFALLPLVFVFQFLGAIAIGILFGIVWYLVRIVWPVMGGLNPDQVLRRGIARTFQNIRLFNNMTVLENVLVGQHTQLKANGLGSLFHTPGVVREEEEARKRAVELLSFFGTALVERQEEYVINLSYADRRRVEIARALAAKPKLLLLDEPTAGMNEAETLEAVKYVRRLRDELNLTILLIEHKLTVTMGISDRIAVLDYGKKIAEGLPEEVRRNEKVIEAYLGKPTTTRQKFAEGLK